MDLISGKIAQIIDEFTVIINRGLNHGVKDEMSFVIFDDGEIIVDPDTKKEIGKLEIVKGKVKVINAQENFSTAKSDEFYTVDYMSGLAALPGSTKRKRLNIGGDASKLSPVEYEIKIGDKVRQIPE